jgi:hypothetical protein
MLMIFFVEVGITMMTVCFHNHVGNFVASFMPRQQATLSTVCWEKTGIEKIKEHNQQYKNIYLSSSAKTTYSAGESASPFH